MRQKRPNLNCMSRALLFNSRKTIKIIVFRRRLLKLAESDCPHSSLNYQIYCISLDNDYEYPNKFGLLIFVIGSVQSARIERNAIKPP